MVIVYILIGIIIGIILTILFLIYHQMRIEGDRDWLMRVTNKKNIPD